MSQPPPMPLLDAKDITFSCGGHTILKNVFFRIQAGDLIVIRGTSGSGKTSLLRLLAFLDSPTSGSITFQGQDLKTLTPHRYRKSVSLLFQTPVFFPGSLLDNFIHIETVNGRPKKEIPFYQDCLRQVGLTENLLERDALNLSQGEKLRASIARALLNQPQVLLLDEPISALDEQSAVVLLTTLKQLNQSQDLTIIMVTHQTISIPFGTRHFQMEDGQLAELSHA